MRKTKKASTLFMQTGPGGRDIHQSVDAVVRVPTRLARHCAWWVGSDLERSVPTSKQYMYQLVEAAVFMNEKWPWRYVGVRKQLSI